MADQLQLRGGTTTEHSTFTGALREVTVDTDKDTLIVHDAATAGGHPLLREDGSNSALSLGTAGTPSIKFTGDTNTGLYSPGADQVAISTGGSGRFFIDANGNAALGTSSPNNYSGYSTLTFNGSNGGEIDFEVGGTLTADIFGNSAGLHLGTRLANDVITFSTNSGTFSEKVRIDSSGRLLVGTSSEFGTNARSAWYSFLQIKGNTSGSTSDGRITLGTGATTGSDTSLGSLYFCDTDGGDRALIRGYSTSAGGSENYPGYLTFWTNGGSGYSAERMRIDSSGNVGIGTASPQEVLDVNGRGRFQGSTSSATSGSGLELAYVSGSTTGSVLTYNRSTSTYLTTNIIGNPLTFSIGATEKVRIDSSGNVGIGTSTVNTKVEIAANNNGVTENNTLRFTDTDTSTQDNQQIGKIEFYSSDASTPGAGVKAYIGAFATDTTPDAYLAFATQDGSAVSTPVERLRIKSDGKVGIGTTNPSYPLHVASNSTQYAYVESTTDTNAGVRFKNTGRDFGIFLDGGSGSSNTLRFYDFTANSDRMRIDSSGRLLIGTSSWSGGYARQVIEGNSISADGPGVLYISRGGELPTDGSHLAQIHFSNTTGDQGASIFGKADGDWASNDYPGRIEFHTTADGASSPTERMRISQDGTVQIATGGSGYATLFSFGAAGTNYISQGTSGDTIFRNTSNSEYARIDSSGRLLVGTSTAPGGGAQYSRIAIQGYIGLDSGAGDFSIMRGETAADMSDGDDIGYVKFTDSSGNRFAYITALVDGTPSASNFPTHLSFRTNPGSGAVAPTEWMRINSDGITAVCSGSGAGTSLYVSSPESASTSNYLIQGRHSGGILSGTQSFRVYTNGNVQNTNNSYGAISDAKLKENIVDASSQWDDLKAIQVRNYNFKEETGQETHTQLGVVAQEVELVSPGLVSEAPDKDVEGNDLGTVTKSVNYSVLYMKAVKALQEAMERIETLEAKVAALEAN